MEKQTYTIKINDGFVEYEYQFRLASTNSIHTILGAICVALRCDVPEEQNRLVDLIRRNNDE